MTNLTFPSSTIMQGFGDLSLHMPPSSAFTNFLIPRLVVVDLDGTDIHLRVGCALSCALFDQCCVSAPLRRISYKVTCLTPCDSRKIQQTCFQWTKALNFGLLHISVSLLACTSYTDLASLEIVSLARRGIYLHDVHVSDSILRMKGLTAWSRHIVRFPNTSRAWGNCCSRFVLPY